MTASIPRFMQTAYDQSVSAEDDRRRESLMKAHMPEPGTTSICRCGAVGYSTSGYLLHVYEVIEADVRDHEAALP